MVHQYCWEWEIKGTNVPEILFYKGFKKKKKFVCKKALVLILEGPYCG